MFCRVLLVTVLLLAAQSSCLAAEPPGEGAPLLLGVASEGNSSPQGAVTGGGGGKLTLGQALKALLDFVLSFSQATSWQIIDLLAQIPDRHAFAEMVRNATGLDLSEILKRKLSGRQLQIAESLLNLDGAVLTPYEASRQFQEAIAEYRRKHGSVSDSSSVLDTRALATYLNNHECVVDPKIVKRFVTGREYELKERIIQERASLGRPLSPGEVYGLALELADGDKYKAVLTVHNMLRALARGGNDSLYEQVPKDKQDFVQRGDRKIPRTGSDCFGVRADPSFFSTNLQSIRRGGDEEGAWYHLFVTATITMTTGPGAAAAASAWEETVTDNMDIVKDPMEFYINLMGIEAGNAINRG